MKGKPLISVIMPALNASLYISEALESILSQTYTHFEILILDDGSQDNTWEIIQKFAVKSKKIIAFRQPTTQGPASCANTLLAKARGAFIARMDADDIALPNRFSDQLHFLLTHKETLAVGGQTFLINKLGKIIGKRLFPLSHTDIYKYCFYFNPLFQPTLMVAKNRLPPDFVFYNNSLTTSEEVELVFKLVRLGKIANLPQTVLLYRIHNANTSLKDIKRTFFITLSQRLASIQKYGYKPSFLGAFATLLQIITVSTLPQNTLFYLYRKLRDSNDISFPNPLYSLHF